MVNCLTLEKKVRYKSNVCIQEGIGRGISKDVTDFPKVIRKLADVIV
jgi:hypothetical protein